MMGPDGTIVERTLGKFLYYFRDSDGEIIRDSDGEIVAEGNLPPREGNLPLFAVFASIPFLARYTQSRVPSWNSSVACAGCRTLLPWAAPALLGGGLAAPGAHALSRKLEHLDGLAAFFTDLSDMVAAYQIGGPITEQWVARTMAQNRRF